jgi:hypothetical protein
MVFRQPGVERRLPASHTDGFISRPLNQLLTDDTPSSHGAQGTYNTASDQALHTEFGTKVVEDVIKIILAKGEIQEGEVRRDPYPLFHNVGSR